ncbi:MAG: glycosyltransferase family 39 protein [Thermoanaerobaculia bacterium]
MSGPESGHFHLDAGNVVPARGAGVKKPDRVAGIAAVLLILVAALGFQGSRGIWEPDEGFYSNVSLGMLSSGDFVTPRLNDVPFLDKPPLLYWSTAAGMAMLGVNEWGARSGQALWFVGTALLVGWLGGRWWGARTGRIAALVYATMLVPCLAANVVTPDTPLAFACALAFCCFWRMEDSPAPGRRALWGTATGAALGLGALAKGPAILVLIAPLGLFLLLRRRRSRTPALWADAGGWAMAVAFFAVALPWYLFMIARLPGAFAYFVDNQIAGRLINEQYARNSGWLGGLIVYLPTIFVGTLPWNLVWLRRTKSPAGALPARPSRGALRSRSVDLLLLLWVTVPAVVFVAASSRLPLYVLPIFAPLALLTARRLTGPGRLLSSPGRRPWLLFGFAILGIVALKAFAATWTSDQDARGVAHLLREAGIGPERRIVTLDVKLNGLRLYGYSRLEPATEATNPYPFYVAAERLDHLLQRMTRDSRDRWILVDRRKAAEVEQAIEAAGLRHEPQRVLSSHLTAIAVSAGSLSDATPAASPHFEPGPPQGTAFRTARRCRCQRWSGDSRRRA